MESMVIKNNFIFSNQYPKNVKFWKHLHRSIIVLVNEVGKGKQGSRERKENLSNEY